MQQTRAPAVLAAPWGWEILGLGMGDESQERAAKHSLRATRDFWNAHPCDGQDQHAQRQKLRYGKEPWVFEKVQQVARRHADIVEIGCGQGTDAITMCTLLPASGSYLGIDLSEASLAAARSAVEEVRERLQVIPRFQQGNAENLPFEDSSLECVYSMGVLHHTPDTEKAINEIHRTLRPGGRAYLFLYRRWGPKVLAAHLLRFVQRQIGRLIPGEPIFFRMARGFPNQKALGTVLLEGTGVPILKSYTRRGIEKLLQDFDICRLEKFGLGLPTAGMNTALDRLQKNPLGYFWYIEIAKPE